MTRYHRNSRQQVPQATMSTLRCEGGPWRGRMRLIAASERSLAVPGIERFRYVRAVTRERGEYLTWSNDETRW